MHKMLFGVILAVIVILASVGVYSFSTISKRLDDLSRKIQSSEKLASDIALQTRCAAASTNL